MFLVTTKLNIILCEETNATTIKRRTCFCWQVSNLRAKLGNFYLLGIFMMCIVDKAKSSWTTLLVLHHPHTEGISWEHNEKCHSNCFLRLNQGKSVSLTKYTKDLLEFFISEVFSKVFNVNIGELHNFGPKFHLSFLAWFEVANKAGDGIKPGK